jgi:Tfp pilus assembly PilM family ATPase
MRRKLLEYRLDSEDKAIDALYLFGEKANSDLVDYLAISPAREVVLVEPFKKLEINSELVGYSEDTPLSSEYTISIGSALRAIE